MEPKEIIALNNEKQKQLNEANAQDYEDMLVYIRISSTKSEQQTEEILLELLEHILHAQNEGKTVRDIFGNDLKAYSQELIEEIPEETKKKQIKFSFRLILIFLAVTSFFKGLSDLIIYYVFDFGNITSTYYLGSGITIVIIDVIIAFIAISIILHWLKNSVFQATKKSKKREFLELWFIMSLILGLFIAVIHFMPNFGTPFSISSFVFLPLGIGLYTLTYLFKN